MLLSTYEKLTQEANKPPAFLFFFYIFRLLFPLTSDKVGFIINKVKPTDWSDDEKMN